MKGDPLIRVIEEDTGRGGAFAKVTWATHVFLSKTVVVRSISHTI